MFKIDFVYNRDTLYINVEGILNKKNIIKVKDRLYSILNKYSISNIVLDVKKTNILDEISFYNFLDDYDCKYYGSLKLIELSQVS